MRLPIVENDPWLLPVESVINERYDDYLRTKAYLCSEYGSIKNFASAHLEYGFTYDHEKGGWFFREWLPHAEEVYLIGDFNGWQMCKNPLSRKEGGIWQIFLPDPSKYEVLKHGSKVKLYIKSADGWNERIPAYIRCTSEEKNHNYTGVFWNPETAFEWDDSHFRMPDYGEVFIYECHIGMAQEKEGIGSFDEFRLNILPRVKELGYNTLQMMALAEHPYYGSFGYHVSNFFAPSCRFGKPEELKQLINEAHKMGIAVIMDIVHSHFVPNVNEGLNRLDGSEDLYCHAGERGNHPHWKSKLFNYGKNEVRRFLLSNLRYWMEEFHIDGFRFDGVTSMLYTHHGYIDHFGSYENYFGKEVDRDAILYLSIANELIHELKPSALSIAEEVSGMPGVALPIIEGGMGFDYRMGMAIPDFWIRLLKDKKEEDWDLKEMWNLLTDRLWNVKTVSYCESHDQAIVGDQTLAFRLMGSSMYNRMSVSDDSLIVDRGIALLKMIRLITMVLGGDAYLNFMGNEFGHPEWIDFPREGNDGSYKHAQRLWSLSEDPALRYHFLKNFDKDCLSFLKKYKVLNPPHPKLLHIDTVNKTLIFTQRNLIYVFNWHGYNSPINYHIPYVPAGKYHLIFHSDAKIYGGHGRIREGDFYFTLNENGIDSLSIYNCNRCAFVFEKID